MSVKKRELKTVEELQSWIAAGADGIGNWTPQGTQPYVIVRQRPQSGGPDWNVVSRVPTCDPPLAWSPHLRHAIGRAKLLFDVR